MDEPERETFVCSCMGGCTVLLADYHPFGDEDERTWLSFRTRPDTRGSRLSRAWAALRGRDQDFGDMLLTRADAERLREWLEAHA